MPGKPVPTLSDCLVERSYERPWLLDIWEPINTKAPSPSRCLPYCCYVRTVIFYHRPYVQKPPTGWRDQQGRFHRSEGGSFADYGQVETRLSWDDVVEFDGEQFEIGGGTVVWRLGRWWAYRWARRRQPQRMAA